MESEITTNTTQKPILSESSALFVPFEPMSWDYDALLDGDGQFHTALDYCDIQSPPMMGIYTMHKSAWPDGSLHKRKTFAVPRRTASGAREHQPMSVAETLWQALLSFCEHRCHTINYDMRGGHRIRIQSGFHDGKQWQFRGSSWEQVTKKAVLTLMPGYWTNNPSSATSGASS